MLLHLGRGHHSGWACRCHPCCIFRSADKVKILFPALNKIFPRLSPWRLVLWIEKTDPRVLRNRDPGLSETRWLGPGRSYCRARPCRAQPKQDMWGPRGRGQAIIGVPTFSLWKGWYSAYSHSGAMQWRVRAIENVSKISTGLHFAVPQYIIWRNNGNKYVFLFSYTRVISA